MYHLHGGKMVCGKIILWRVWFSTGYPKFLPCRKGTPWTLYSVNYVDWNSHTVGGVFFANHLLLDNRKITGWQLTASARLVLVTVLVSAKCDLQRTVEVTNSVIFFLCFFSWFAEDVSVQHDTATCAPHSKQCSLLNRSSSSSLLTLRQQTEGKWGNTVERVYLAMLIIPVSNQWWRGKKKTEDFS